jgi:hypothetical protein
MQARAVGSARYLDKADYRSEQAARQSGNFAY